MKAAALRWLIGDTFAHARASGIWWLMLATNGIAIAFAFAIGCTSFADSEAKVRDVQFLLAGLAANSLGMLLALTFTAGFLPAFTDPSTALILLAKPVPRWWMFLGKYLGVQALFAVQATIFVVGTWIALGVSTGFWTTNYFLALPVLMLNFAAFFSFSALLAVATRSTVACVFGVVLFWLLCAMMNIGRHTLVAFDLEHFSGASRWIADAAYWLLPKPLDAIAVMHEAVGSTPLAERVSDFGVVQDKGAFHPFWSFASSLAFPLAITMMSAYELETHDY